MPSELSPPGAIKNYAIFHSPHRRVHITKATLSHLGGVYAVEEVCHWQRDAYLKENKVKTYLVIDPWVSPHSGPHARLSTQRAMGAGEQVIEKMSLSLPGGSGLVLVPS